MDLDRLRVFLAIVDAGTMAAASRTLHLTQPALSRSLKLLEEEVDVTLFERRARRLVLTAAGRALVPEARALFASVTQMTTTARRAAERGYADLRIGSIDSVATYLLPRALTRLRARYPELQIKLITARTPRLLAQVAEGALDMAIVAHSGPPPAAKSKALGRYRLQLFGRADRFPDLRRHRTDAEVSAAGYPRVRIAPPTSYGAAAHQGSYAIASNIASVKALVLAGFGVGKLLGFMLTKVERKQLQSAPIVDDQGCKSYLVTPASWDGKVEREISTALHADLSKQISAAD